MMPFGGGARGGTPPPCLIRKITRVRGFPKIGEKESRANFEKNKIEGEVASQFI